MNKKYMKNTAILFASMTITKIVGAVFKIPLANILGGTGMGYFSITVHCPDAIIYKIDFHAVLLQFSRSIQRIHRVTRKPRQFTGDNQVKAVFLCVLYHPHK